MKRIKFEKLKLLNFCGIREGEYEFGDNVTIISGKNGVGKSTLASAIMYVLFGTDIKGRQLDIKTLDENNNVIKDLSHEVELTLLVDEDVVILKRVLTDSWKGESVKNTFKYFVDGEVTTAGDFKKVIDDICTEEMFRLCCSPTEFVSKPWQDQFSLLRTIVPSVSYDDIAGGEEKYDFIKESVKKDALEKLLHHIKYRKNEVKDSLEQIPPRLSELNKLLPKKDDWEAVSNELKKKEQSFNETSNKILSIKNGNADSVAKQGIRNQLSFANKRIANMEQSARNEATKTAEMHQSDLLTRKEDVSKANKEVEDLKADIRECTTIRVNLNKEIEEIKKKAKELGEKFTQVTNSKWKWNDDDSICPHCLQPLPVGQLNELKKESEANFKEEKAKQLKALNLVASDMQQQLNDSRKLLKENEEKENDTLNKLKTARETLSTAERELEKIKLETPKSYDDILSEKEEYQNVKKEIDELQEKLDAPVVPDEKTKEMLSSLENESKYLAEEIKILQARLSKIAEFDKITARINELGEDKQKFLSQIDELDEKLAIVKEYVQKSYDILSERVNEKFSYVTWIMSKSNLEGERSPYCECCHNGIPYSKLNGAAKINAGIDIAHTISEFYEIVIPMIIDNSESVQNPIYFGGQQIRLSVGEHKKLDFEYQDGNQD